MYDEHNTLFSQNLISSDKPMQDDGTIMEAATFIIAEFNLSYAIGWPSFYCGVYISGNTSAMNYGVTRTDLRSIIIIIICEFFTPALAGGLSLESERQQITSGLLDSSRYSDRSYQCCKLNGLDSSSHFQLFRSPFQSFGNRSKRSNNKWYHRHFQVPQFFFFFHRWQNSSICASFTSFYFQCVVR